MRLAFAGCGRATRLTDLHQAGAARARFPKPAPGASLEAVLLNTAGGLTGGDRIDIEVGLVEASTATITSAAAEKIYRSTGDATEISVELRLGEGAACNWLPQPTILFNGSNLDRRTRVSMAASARFLAIEMLVYGRTAMGEDVHRGTIRDAWRIKRDGRLVFADTTRVTGAVADALDRSATLDGARATAMLIYAAPDAHDRLEGVRTLLEGASIAAAASSWNGILLVRGAAKNSRELQRDLLPIMVHLSGQPLPRVWQC